MTTKTLSFAAAKNSILLAISILLAANVLGQTTWTTDKNHSQLHFSVLHFGIAHINGIFSEFTVSMTSEKEDFSDAQVEMVVQVASISTHMEFRDNDLKSDHWFDAQQFPVMIFKSSFFKKQNGDNYLLAGNMTMHGITKPVLFNVIFNGWAVTRTQKKTAGFTIKGQVKRSEFKVGGSAAETGVSDQIDVWADVEIGKN